MERPEIGKRTRTVHGAAWRQYALLICLTVQGLSMQAVSIPDAGLRAALESALGKPAGAEIAASELAQLKQLQAANRGIVSLEGLQAATGLETLILRNNAIVDLAPLQSLTLLQRLEIDANQIKDLSSLGGLVNLRFLFAHENDIDDLEPLASLAALEDLILFDNAISDISALVHLTQLKRLNLSRNAIREVDALAALLSLEVLFLADNGICDVHALGNLPSLGQLDLSGNRITDAEPLYNLTSLQSSDLRLNHLSDPAATAAPLLAHNSSLTLHVSPQRENRAFEAWLTEWNIPSAYAGPEAILPNAHLANILLHSMGTGPDFVQSQVVTLHNAFPVSAPRLRFQRDLAAGGIIRTVETSPNLQDWVPATIEKITVLAEPVPNVQLVEAVIRLEEPNRFLRLNVTALP